MTFEERHSIWCAICRFVGMPGDNGSLIAELCPDLIEEER